MAVENATVAVFILVGIVALDFHDFGDEAPAGAACEMHDNVERIADVGLNGAVREVHAALQDAAGESREALPRGGGVNGRKTAGVGGTKGPRSQENGTRRIKEPERTATGVTRVREWRDGVPAKAESQGERL